MRQLLGWFRPQEYHGLDYGKAPLPAWLSGARLSTGRHGGAGYHLTISPAGIAGYLKRLPYVRPSKGCVKKHTHPSPPEISS